MFKQILDALTAKYKGVDARILTRMARKLAKEVKEADEIQAKVEEITMMDFIEMEGNRRANAAKEEATRDYESKYNLKNGKPVEQADKTVTDTDEDVDTDDDDDNAPLAAKTKGGRSGKSKSQTKMESQLAQLTEAVTALTGTVKGMQQERTTKTRRQQFEQLFEGVDDKVKNRYMRNFDRLNFKDDEDFNNWMDEMTPQVTEELQGLQSEEQVEVAGQNGGAQGAQRRRTATPPLGGRGRSKPGELSPEFKAYQAKKQARMASTRYSTMAGLPQMQSPTFEQNTQQGTNTPQQ